ncbi:MAG: cell division topological specificity factor MinE [Peptococcaceae bacterium]|nr:cell division topological specificity factor MinE [Peptococcaceae bacterium]
MERESTSRDVAKQRLRQVLVHDRAHLAPELMAALKQSLITAAGEYVEINPNDVSIQLELKGDASTLIIKIPVLSIVRERKT